MTQLRIALIGNMNNNHFALMRHLRDLGADAHLFLYSNEHPHFLPQCDTRQWDRWRAFVHDLGVSNGGRSAFWQPLGTISRKLDEFDAWLGNGISPVIFLRMGRRLDVFVPYGDGCEFIIEHEWNWARPFSSVFSLIRKVAMERALPRAVDLVIISNVHAHSLDTYRRIGMPTVNKFVPIIYEERDVSPEPLPRKLAAAAARMDAASVAVFSHVAHFWKSLPVGHYMAGVGKRNQWLIEGFARHVTRTGDRSALLAMVEYGPDVAHSKDLIASLGMGDQVLWLPLMTRSQIMVLLEHADIGGSEFAGMLWGGAGWEFLCQGVPMLHYLDKPEEYELPDRPLPPFFNTASPDAITDILGAFNRPALRALGAQAREWYDTFQGRALAAEYLALLERAALSRRKGLAA